MKRKYKKHKKKQKNKNKIKIISSILLAFLITLVTSYEYLFPFHNHKYFKLKPTAKIENPSARFARTEGLLYKMVGWVYEMGF